MSKKPFLSLLISTLFVLSLTCVRAQQELVTSKSFDALPPKGSITDDQGRKYVPGQLLVKFKESKVNLKSAQGKTFARTFAHDNGMQNKETIEDSNITVLEFDPSIPVKEKLNQIKNNIDIEYAEPNYIYKLQSFDDPRLSELRGLDTIQWHQSVATFSGTTNTTGTIVAVIDVGVAYDHPDLAQNMRDGSSCKNDGGTTIGGCIHGYDFANNDKEPYPLASEHGTHVAGTIAAVANNTTGIVGVNPNAKIMAIRAGDQDLLLSAIIKGINFARHNGAKIINASFGDTADSSSMYDAINAFRSAGGIFVAAAGNETNNNDSTHVYPCSYTLDNIICVAATNSSDTIAYFSNYGATSVDVGAPGIGILSTSLSISTGSLIYEDFESLSIGEVPSGWIRSGGSINNRFAYNIGTGRGNVLFSDMNTPNYANNIDSSIIISANTASATRIGIDFWTLCDTEYTANGDYMSIEARPTPSTGWTTIGTRNEYSLDNDSNSGGYITDNLTYDLNQSFASNEFQIRFRWRTNASNNSGYIGCLVDDVAITSHNYTQIYESKDGTSMATPHVAGLASLAWNYKPGASYSEIRNAVINGGDVLASLSGKTVSSKRINALTTLGLLADTTPVTFSFNALIDQIPNSYATGNTIVVSGINAGTEISVINGEYKINSSGWTTTTGVVYNQDLVTLRIMTATGYLTTTTGTLTIGGISGTLTATTQEDPAAPSCILFKDPATWTSGNVILTISGNAAVIDSGYSFNLSGAFSDTRTGVATIGGTYYAYVKNEAGTIRSCSTGVYIDKTAPVITISSHTNNQQITGSTSTVNLAGTATDVGCQLSSLLLNGVALATGSSWSSTLALDGGGNAITITGTDCVGNTTAAAINLIKKNYVTNTPTYFINGTRATIGFTTDLPAQGFVRYGTTSDSLTSIATSSTTGRSHSIIIDGLNTNTTYYYQAYANNDGYDGGPSSIASFFTPNIIDPSTILTQLTTTGTVQLSGASSNGITFTTPGVLILVGSGQANNKLEINFSGFVIQSNGWDGFIVPPTVLGSSDTNNATTAELGLSSTTNTILTTVQAGSTGSTLVASTANTYFKISFVVSSGISGEKLDIYRSSNGSIRGANAPDTYCKLDANKVCTFRTDHLSYFTTVRVSSAGAGGGGGGGGGSTSGTGTCTSIQLVCIDGEYEMKPGVYCEGGSLGGTCSGTGTAVEDILMTLISSIKGSGSIENSPFKTERNNAYLYAYQIGITTMPTIKQANMTGSLIRSHMAKMMVNYAINVLKKTPNTSLTCTFSDIENETQELQGYIKQACQLGIMGQGISQFYPKGKVSRAEFGTVLSRALYGNTYNTGTPYYINHLKILKNKAIITNTDPTIREMRAYVMLMLMRASTTLD